jgi:hypothetical protein
VPADITLFKINNPEVRNYLLKYNETSYPDESALRKNCLLECYEETLNKSVVLCGEANIWLSIDKRTDASLWKVLNIVIELLKNCEMLSKKLFLLSC